MVDLLIRKTIKNYTDYRNPAVRSDYITLAGKVGILLNLLLFGVKLAIGLLINSIAIISDAFNNLSDILTSVVAIFGSVFSNKPADKEHPLGHGRFEYVASLVVAFLIMAVGLELLKSSVESIRNPQPLEFNWVLIGILALSLLVKIYMYSYNNKIGKLIDSPLNFGVAIDSRNDVVATSAVILSIIVSEMAHVNIDGFSGFVVALLVMYSGFNIGKETTNRILGETPDKALVDEIERIILSGKNIIGVHDLIVHDYGAGKILASAHAEVPANMDVESIHDIIDALEERVENETGVSIVIHMDPAYCTLEK